MRNKRSQREKTFYRSPADSHAASLSIPRIARLMALAIQFDRLVRAEEFRDYAELARLGRVTRARMTQIMKLLDLAPDIQEQILFLTNLKGLSQERSAIAMVLSLATMRSVCTVKIQFKSVRAVRRNAVCGLAAATVNF